MTALYKIVQDDHPPLPDGTSQALRDFLLQCFKKQAQVWMDGWMDEWIDGSTHGVIHP